MAYEVRPTAGDTSWFVHDRFGMFVHWGVYALPARHEWARLREGGTSTSTPVRRS